MKIVIIDGWEIGFRKVEFTSLLRNDFGYSLSEAKAVTDALLDAQRLELEVPDEEADYVLSKCLELGVRATLNATEQNVG